MTAVTSMPCRWLGDSDKALALFPPRINTQIEGSLRVPIISPMVVNDELFFDTPTSTPAGNKNGELSMPSYLVLEPVTESVAKEVETDWRRYEPPQELLHVPENTSEEIQRILEPSIEGIKSRYIEEEERRIAQAKAKRASLQPPKKQSLTNGSLHPFDMLSGERNSGSRLSAESATSTMTNDSGYASQSLSPSSGTMLSLTSDLKGKGRSFGFRSIFGRRNKSVGSFDALKKEGTSSIVLGSLSILAPSTLAPGASAITLECVSCLDDFDSTEMVTLTCHSYCKDCFTRLINTALDSETHWPAKCCLSPIPASLIQPHLSPALKAKFALRTSEWSIPPNARVYCSKAACSAWIPPSSITISTHKAKCPTCSTKTCTICRGNSHGKSECPSDIALIATSNLAEMEGWKRCYQCQAFVEHNQGCRHMTCRCKAQFCYICTAKWCTCDCTDEQLAEIQTRAAEHREEAAAETARQGQERERLERERIAREEAEEEERIVLQMVADFVAAEQERERIDREAREEVERLAREAEERLAEEARRVAEEARRGAVGARFRMLRSELEALHNIQHTLMAERYAFENARRERDTEDKLAILALRHPGELARLGVESRKTVRAAEDMFAAEYTVRLKEERWTEAAYVDELKVFWRGKVGADDIVAEKRDELRAERRRECRLWEGYRRMRILGVKEGEERKIESLRVRQREERREVLAWKETEGSEAERTREVEAEWVSAVVGERSVLLGAEEGRALAGDVEV